MPNFPVHGHDAIVIIFLKMNLLMYDGRLGTVLLYLVIASTYCMPQSHAFCYDLCRSKFTNQV